MKKIYALAAAAFLGLAANAQDGAPLYATGAGNFAGGEWAAATPDQFTYADGKYTLEITNLTQIKISTVCDPESGNGGWDGFNSGALTCVYGEEQGVEVALVQGDANIACPWKGDYTITVAGDLSTIILSTETPKPTGPTPIYFRGDMNGWLNDADEATFAAWELKEIEGHAGIYEFTCADDQLIAQGETFKIADADWNAFNIGGDGEAILLDVETPVYNGGNPANISFEEDWNGVCYLKVATDDCAIFFSNDKEAENPFITPGAVNGITVENNSVAAYYTIDGVRVANPENGLYIVVKDGKASKVLVK